MKNTVAVIFVVLGLAGIASPEIFANQREPQSGPQSAAPSRKDIPGIAKAANGAIVSIVMSDKDGKPIAQGSGFLVSKDGEVVTNYHVISEGSSAIVKFPDGAFYVVDGVLASDKARDVAIIKVHGGNFQALTLGNSDRVQVGEEVVAIGNPLSLESTVSNGIVSAVRTIEEEGGKFLQITAPISPGSSGGPLFNMAGEVVGITTLKFEGGENLNFAIPINDTKLLLQKRFAKVQELPNEAEKETLEETPIEKHVAATPAQEQACSERAEKFIQYKRAQYGLDEPKVEYASHYDAKSGVCFVENGFYFVEGKAYPSGKKYFPQIQIENAFSEGRGGRLYASFSFGSACTIRPPNAQEIPCRSKEEFDDLTFKYFGIARQLSGSVTVVAESSSDYQHAPIGQLLKDATYCHQNPQNFLQFPGKDEPVSCRKLNSDIEEDRRLCKTDPQIGCESLLRNITMIEAGGILPPNTKISAIPAEGRPTWEQYWGDMKYCDQNPTNNLQMVGGELQSCGEMNAAMAMREKDCKSKNPKDNPETCKSFLKGYKDLKAGRL